MQHALEVSFSPLTGRRTGDNTSERGRLSGNKRPVSVREGSLVPLATAICTSYRAHHRACHFIPACSKSTPKHLVISFPRSVLLPRPLHIFSTRVKPRSTSFGMDFFPTSMGPHSLPSPPSPTEAKADESPNGNDDSTRLPSPPSSATPPPGKRKEREDSIEPESSGKKPRTDQSEAEGGGEPPSNGTSDGTTGDNVGVRGGEGKGESNGTPACPGPSTCPAGFCLGFCGRGSLCSSRESSSTPEPRTALPPNSSIFEGGPGNRDCCQRGKCDKEFQQFVIRPGTRLIRSPSFRVP